MTTNRINELGLRCSVKRFGNCANENGNHFINADNNYEAPYFATSESFIIGGNRKERFNYFLNHDKPRVRLAERLIVAGLIVATVAMIGLWLYHDHQGRYARMMENVRSEEYRAAERALFK